MFCLKTIAKLNSWTSQRVNCSERVGIPSPTTRQVTLTMPQVSFYFPTFFRCMASHGHVATRTSSIRQIFSLGLQTIVV